MRKRKGENLPLMTLIRKRSGKQTYHGGTETRRKPGIEKNKKLTADYADDIDRTERSGKQTYHGRHWGTEGIWISENQRLAEDLR